MKYVLTVLAYAGVAVLLACGGSSDNIKTVQVNPQQAEGTAPSGAVGFTATGTFESGQSRLLTSQDGINWVSSNTTVASINPLTGQATCLTEGGATITAAVPSDLTYQGGGHTSSTNVSGTASLQCVLPG